MTLRGVIFDLDGTLGDTLPATFAAFRSVFRARLGAEFSDREIRALFGPDERGVFMRMVPDAAEAATAEFLAEYERAHGAHAAPFEGINELLDTLRGRGVACAVVTGKGAASAALSLRLLGLEGYFELVESGSAQGAVKAECMQRVLERWRLPGTAVAGIGDAPSDVRAARAVGAAALGAAWASGTDAAALLAERPDALFGRVGEAHEWLIRRL